MPGESNATWDVEAEMIADLGFDLSVTRREATALEKTLESLSSDVPIVPLGTICRLSGGRGVSSEHLSNERPDEDSVPYVRIGDIHLGQTAKVTSWLSSDLVAEQHLKFRLRPGDVLLSKSGTIGKTGVVRNGAVGGIASSGIFVLSPDTDQIDPNFLAAYLQSRECQEWLQTRTSGSVISGLRMQYVEELPVPLPPLIIQHRVAADVRDHQVDALTQLGVILSQKDSDPIVIWLDRSLNRMTEAGETSGSTEVMKRVFGSGFRAIINKGSETYFVSTPLATWFRTLQRFSDLFWYLEKAPRGPSFLNILQQADADLTKAMTELSGNTVTETKARELSCMCLDLLREKIEDLLNEVVIVIEPKSINHLAGKTAEVSMLVRNESPMPLWNFSMGCQAWGFTVPPFYLPENDVREITVEVTLPAEVKSRQILVEWNGSNLSGQCVEGKVELLFMVEEFGAPDNSIQDLGRSPYFHGPPVGPERNDVFFGREALIARIKEQIQSGNTVLLEGNRRSGKSSILKHLEGKDVIPGWLAVFADFQGAEGDKKVAGMPNEAIWRALARSLASALAKLKVPIPLPDGAVLPAGSRLGIAEGCRNGISKDAPWEDFLEYFQVILELLAGLDLGLVLMIDEFDKLQEGIDNGVTSPQIPENIRFLIQSHHCFVAILTGSRRMQRLRHEYWSALYGLGNRVGVTALDPESARKLVTEPVSGKLTYTEEATDLIITLTARQPFLIQYLCNRVFELVTHHGIRSVGKKLVEEAAESFVRDNEHFASLWDYAKTDQRRFLIDICHRQAIGPDPVTFGLLQQQLVTERIEVSDGDLDRDLKFLQELEIIEFTGAEDGGVYRLTVPLMGQWIDQQQEYAALRDKARKEQENTR